MGTTNNIIIRPKDRDAWLDERKSGIGSSEVATIVGLNPFETPYQLYRRKKGLDAPKVETFAMKAGHYLEDAVARFWADATGGEVIQSSAGDWIIVCREKPFMRVSPDRTYWPQGAKHNDANKGILECKTTQKRIETDDIPKHWFCQLQYQLGVAGMDFGSLAWLSSGREFGYQSYNFDPDIFGWLSEEVEKFWTDCIIGGQEPAPVSADDVILKFARPDSGKTVEADGAVMGNYHDLKKIRAEIDEMTAKKESLEAAIKVAMGDAETLSFRGQTLATWKQSKDSEKFDTAAFKHDYPDLARQFTKTVPGSRRFLVK